MFLAHFISFASIESDRRCVLNNENEQEHHPKEQNEPSNVIRDALKHKFWIRRKTNTALDKRGDTFRNAMYDCFEPQHWMH
mmetsp:Transcript_9925/g.15092  ORF Transcript_9925/g.15092 Transcript_9925/m.15092 type:complete len:81 (+) Transcript_9925:108-350(+)